VRDIHQFYTNPGSSPPGHGHEHGGSPIPSWRLRVIVFGHVCGASARRSPTSPRPSLNTRPLELTGERLRVDGEAGRDDLERLARLVALRGLANRVIGRLPDGPPALDGSAVEVVDDRGPADAEFCGQHVDRGALEVGAHEPVDLVLGQPSLHRV